MVNFDPGLIRNHALTMHYGPGSIINGKDRRSYLVSSLENWFKELEEKDITKINQFIIEEPRLKNKLNASELRQAPINPDRTNENYNFSTNQNYDIPLKFFPIWHSCRSRNCSLLFKNHNGINECNNKNSHGYAPVRQVRFIAACEDGHLQEFPWREWVHGNDMNLCNGNLTLEEKDNYVLGKVIIKCECKERRSLLGTKDIEQFNFNCNGEKPWTNSEPENCNKKIKLMLRDEPSLYFPIREQVVSIPTTNKENELYNTLKIHNIYNVAKAKYETLIQVLSEEEAIKNTDYYLFDENKSKFFEHYPNEVVTNVLTEKFDINENSNELDNLREEEYKTLLNSQDHEYISVVKQENNSQNKYQALINQINLVPRLRIVSALKGFDRIKPNPDIDSESLRKRLYGNKSNERWFPAVEVWGEGVFIEFNNDYINNWQNSDQIQKRMKKMISLRKESNDPMFELPKFFAIHTFSHGLIRTLGEYCGYSSSSLAELLYIDQNMSGLLIYTGEANSDGTLGGLISMSRTNNIHNIFDIALSKFEQCSRDPICYDIGTTYGQGYENLNGAACNTCSMVSETSCIYNNKYLDRQFVITPNFVSEKLGLFDN